MKMFDRIMAFLKKLLQGKAAVIIPAAAACVLAAPSLFSGLCLEDYYFRAVMVDGAAMPDFARRSPLDAFSFSKRNDTAALRACMDYGICPWWTSKNFTVSFCRPLTSVTHWLDFKVLKNAYWAMHLHSILWFVLLALAAAAAYRRFLATAWIAGLAALLYCLDDAHAAGAAFLANRSAIIAAAFGMLTLCSFDTWRRTRSPAAGGLSMLFFSAGLLAAEAQLCVCAYLISYAVFIEKGAARQRFAALIPFAVIIILWRSIYVLFSFAVTDSSVYIDPLRQTGAFLLALPPRIAALLLAQVLEPHAMLLNHLPAGLDYVYGAAALIVLLVLARPLRPLFEKNPVMCFFGLGSVLSLLPLSVTLPDDRLLFLPGFGAMGIIAAFLAEVAARGSALGRSALAKTVAVIFFIVHLFIAPLQFQANAFMAWGLQRHLTHMANVLERTPGGAAARIVVLNSPIDFFFSYLPYVMMERGLPAPKEMLLLSAGQTQVILERTGSQTLRMRLPQGLLASVFDRVFRNDPASLKTGDRVELSPVAITVNQLTDDGRPSDVNCAFSQPLEAMDRKWFYWTQEGLVPFALPPVGQSVTIAPPPYFLRLLFMET